MSEDGGFRPAPLILDVSVLSEAARGVDEPLHFIEIAEPDGEG